MDVESVLREMLDREQITALTREYALGIDRRDWERYRSIFTDEVEIDLASWSGAEPRLMKADEWVSGVRAGITGFQATQHFIVPYIITVDGDGQATCLAYMYAMHFLPNDRGDNWHWLGGHYTDRAVRTPSGWKLRAVKLTVGWTAGNRHVFDLARERYAAMQQEA